MCCVTYLTVLLKTQYNQKYGLLKNSIFLFESHFLFFSETELCSRGAVARLGDCSLHAGHNNGSQ